MAEIETKTFKHTIMYILTFLLTMMSVWILAFDNHNIIKWWYSLLLSFLFVTRIYSFYRKDYLLYLLELCYVVNFVSIFYIPLGFDIKYIYPFMHGPLACYALIFGDALLPHDWDRTTSYAIHVLGAIFTRRLYWNGNPAIIYTLSDLTFYNFLHNIQMSFIIYLCWMIPYSLFFLIPYNGKKYTMAKYVNRLKNTDDLTPIQKFRYIRDHMLFANLGIVIGIISMYCWQFNYAIVFCEIMSGILNGGWLYYTGKRFNTRKFLIELWCKTNDYVKIDSNNLSIDFKIKNDTHVELKPFTIPKFIKQS